MKTKISLTVACGALLAVSATNVLAEGSLALESAHGINRRVATGHGGQLSTAGTVTISTFLPVNTSGGWDTQVNRYNNKATAYLGGAAILNDRAATQCQFDAGLQFETGTFGGYTSLGWFAFIARESGGGGSESVNPYIWNAAKQAPEQWCQSPNAAMKDKQSDKYIGSTQTIGTDITFTILRGRYVQCKMGIVGDATTNHTFIWSSPIAGVADYRREASALHPIAPWRSGAYINADQTAGVGSLVKRVSGLTRSAAIDNSDQVELDGSWTSSVWSGCTVDGLPWTEANGTTLANNTVNDTEGTGFKVVVK